MTYQFPFIRQRAHGLVSSLALAILALTIPAFGSTWQVAAGGTDIPSCGIDLMSACQTVQYTITNIAVSGDTIVVQPGTYVEQLTISKNLTIQGSQPVDQSTSVLDGGGQGTVVTVPSGITVTLEQLVIQHGASIASISNAAGGIYNRGTLSLVQSTVQNNQATATNSSTYAVGGGILNQGSLAILLSTVENNSGLGGCATAGGLYTIGTSLTVRNSIFSGNRISSSGCSGMIANADGIQLSTGTISRTYLNGNGMSVAGSITLAQSTVTGNIVDYSGKLTIINSTSTGPIVFYSLGRSYGTADISNSTVSYIRLGNPLLSIIRNSILLNCSGEFTSQDYNILPTSASGCYFVGGGHDLIGASANLGPLTDNGGPTPTSSPQPGSPAINGGNPAGCLDSAGQVIAFDQRLLPRQMSPTQRCDIGAVEIQ